MPSTSVAPSWPITCKQLPLRFVHDGEGAAAVVATTAAAGYGRRKKKGDGIQRTVARLYVRILCSSATAGLTRGRARADEGGEK